MAGLEAALRAPRDALAVAYARSSPTAQDAAPERRAQPPQGGRLPASGPASSATPPAAGRPLLPEAVRATLAADRALFATVSPGRHFVSGQGALLAAQNAARLLPQTSRSAQVANTVTSAATSPTAQVPVLAPSALGDAALAVVVTSTPRPAPVSASMIARAQRAYADPRTHGAP